MTDVKKQLATWIDDDRDKIIEFLCEFVRAKSPNPPGDTTLAAAHVTRFLEANGLPFRVIAPQPTMPNIVGAFDTGKPGHHLVLNGHMDVFPADAKTQGWTQDPWGGAIAGYRGETGEPGILAVKSTSRGRRGASRGRPAAVQPRRAASRPRRAVVRPRPGRGGWSPGMSMRAGAWTLRLWLSCARRRDRASD